MFGNRNPFPLIDSFIRRFHGSEGYEMDFLRARASRSRSFEHYDFNIKALDTTNLWTTATGATTTTWAVRAEAGGWIRGVLGTTIATSGMQLYQPQKYWTGTSLAGAAFLWRSDLVDNVRVEMGFADALPSVNTNLVNNMTTPTFNTATAGAVFMYNHTNTTTTAGLYMIGSTTAASKVAVTTNLPQAATPHFAAIEVEGRKVTLWLGSQGGPVAAASAGITAADGLIPFLMASASNSTSKNIDIDTIWTWSGRLGSGV